MAALIRLGVEWYSKGAALFTAVDIAEYGEKILEVMP